MPLGYHLNVLVEEKPRVACSPAAGRRQRVGGAQIRELLAETFDVVGVVSSGEELETAFEALTPQVVVTDVVMPGIGGLMAARRILRRHPGTPIVLLSMIGDPPVIRASLSSGVHAYVLKDDAASELVPAIQAAIDGRSYVSAAGLCQDHNPT